MSRNNPTFRVSTGLKNVIGRDLITSDYVAVFELVKNSFDAHATDIQVVISDDEITVVDDGKGMTADDVLDKWLFVAYSAKADETEDRRLTSDFRKKIRHQGRGFAGNKGIGRFSADRLGATLDMYSRAVGSDEIVYLRVDWQQFEEDPTEEFRQVEVQLGTVDRFPDVEGAKPPRKSGTMLLMKGLRDEWDASKVVSLRAYLAKLVDPFEPSNDLAIRTIATDLTMDDDDQGRVGNDILTVIEGKTTSIEMEIADGVITTTLKDRGEVIYSVREPSPYTALEEVGASVRGRLFYLNRKAKHNFTLHQKVEPVKFGNLFLFVNGFRVFPIGEETDDTFGILRRKQQGTSRYLGLRDILGKVDVEVADRQHFRETSSRDGGLVASPQVKQLYEAITTNFVRRLERYVVPVQWADKAEGDREDVSGLRSDRGRTSVIKVVRDLVASKNVELLDYSEDLVDVVSERTDRFEESMAGLALVAEETGDARLLKRVESSRRRYEEMKALEAVAREKAEKETKARKEAEERAEAAETRAGDEVALRERAEVQASRLLALRGTNDETLVLLHHQVIIYASEVEQLVKRCLVGASDGTSADGFSKDLERIALMNSKILAVTRLATIAGMELEGNKMDADIVQFMREYVEDVASSHASVSVQFDDGGIELQKQFKPIEIAVVVDNLLSNARKAKATTAWFKCKRPRGGRGVEIRVTDDGMGIDEKRVDTEKIFELGYSGKAGGSGLGLYHAQQVLGELGGTISVEPESEDGGAAFVIVLRGGRAK